MKRTPFIKFSFAIEVLISLAIIFSSPSYAARIILENADAPNEGLNDSRSVSPVGGNTGTTLGIQRRKLLGAVFDVLESTIDLNISIRVRVAFDPLTCDKFSGVVGGAAPTAVASDFEGAPEPDVLYPIAIANQHAEVDLDPRDADIEVTINSSVDYNNNCLDKTNFYYGLDGGEPYGTINLFSTLLHEMIHGLGFLSLVEPDGGFPFDLKDQFSQYIYDYQYNKYWPELSKSQRADSFDNTYYVAWRAPEIIFRGERIAGTAFENHWNGIALRAPYLYTPSPVELGSSISHWNGMTPSQLMEPFVSSPPIVVISDYERAALFDIGWPLTQPLPIIDGDGDGVRDRDDHFPDNPNESADNDHDLIGDNEDLDDDNDLMPDSWEADNGTDPFTDDSQSDPDADGFSNYEEMLARTNPLASGEFPELLTGYFTDFSAPELPLGWYKISTFQEPNNWALDNETLKAPANRQHTINFGGLFRAGDKIVVDAVLDNAGQNGCSPAIAVDEQLFNGFSHRIVTFEDYPKGSVIFGQPKMFVYEVEADIAGVTSLKFKSVPTSAQISCPDAAYVQMDNFAIIGPDTDIDGDGRLDFEELELGLDPRIDDSLLDSDADGLNNLEEILNSTEIHNSDSDADGLSDGDEVKIYYTNPLSHDSDNDGMDDKWEIDNGLLPSNPNDSTEDLDGDGYTNYEEYITDTDPTNLNSIPSFINSLSEHFENDNYLNIWKTTPRKTSFIATKDDSFSGMRSIQTISNTVSQINISGEFSEGLLSFMLKISTQKFFLIVDGNIVLSLDISTHSDWESVSYLVPAGIHQITFSNADPSYIPCETVDLPCRLANRRNRAGVLKIDTAKFVSLEDDADGDGMNETFENNNSLNSSINDSNLDLDSDGFSNLEEFLADTLPNNPISFPSSILYLEGDFDADGLTDDDETDLYGTNSSSRDSDNDLIPDGWELLYGFNPLDSADANLDGDNDGFNNLEEFGGNSNPLIGTSAPQESTWQAYQGNAQHTGYAAITIDIIKARELWSKTLFAGSSLHSVVTFGGQVFVSSDTYNGTQKLSSLNTTNGTELWLHDFGNIQKLSGPAISKGKVFIQTGGHGDTFLYGFEPRTGSIRIQSAFSNQWSRFIAPTPFADDIYIQGGYYGGSYSFNAVTGKENWFSALPQRDNWAPAVNDGYVFACLGAELTALDRQTGLKAYGIPTSACNATHPNNTTSPVLGHNSKAFAIGFGDLVSFDLIEQAINWKRSGSYTGLPALGLGLVTSISSGKLAVHNEIDGSLLWIWSPPSESLQGNPLLTNSHIFVSTNIATYAINLKTHLQDWSYNKGGRLAISKEVLFISSDDGTLSAISLSDTDGDGMSDNWETDFQFDPNDPSDAALDGDDDGLSNLEEYSFGTNPNNPDSDSDGVSDKLEIEYGSDPNDSVDYPEQSYKPKSSWRYKLMLP